jgi:hypothetical protein
MVGHGVVNEERCDACSEWQVAILRLSPEDEAQ